MKLTSREIEYLKNLSSHRKKRRIAAWFGLALATVLSLANAKFGWFGPELTLSIAVVLGMAIIKVIDEYGTPVEDRLLDVLRRYVNGDAEAIRQIADSGG